MRLSIFNDELGIDITDGISIIRDWGLEWVDFRGHTLGKHFEQLDPDELVRLRKLVDDHGLKTACLQSSLAKVHLPEPERLEAEKQKLEAIIRAADALDCRLVRAFFYWQPKDETKGRLHELPDMLQKVLDITGPLCDRAAEAGITFAFENCGCTVPECFAVLDKLNRPEFGLAWDCANDWLGADDPPDDNAIAERVRRSRCVHAKARGAVPGIVETEVPWEKILSALKAGGFTGPVSIETHNPDKSVTNIEMSRRVLERLRRAWPK